MGTARYDKYDPISGGFRAPLAAAWDVNSVGIPFAVALDANGRVVKVAAADTAKGVLVIDSAKAAGDVVDVMTAGEIVDVESLAAGTTYFSKTDATLETAAPAAGANKVQIGHTVESTRLVVRVQKVQG
jgi:hypothetical protein